MAITGLDDVIKKLENLATMWPKGLMLFSASGTLLVADSKTGQVLTSVDIPNDGGDPKIETVNGISCIVFE